MKFGGLSEEEVADISRILTTEGISFSIDKDHEIEEFNQASMQNNLRHYAPPNISTHILAITIEDNDFSKLSDEARLKLLDFGITDQIPSPEDFIPHTGESIHKELVKGPVRMIAFNFKHQLIVTAIFLVIWWIFG